MEWGSAERRRGKGARWNGDLKERRENLSNGKGLDGTERDQMERRGIRWNGERSDGTERDQMERKGPDETERDNMERRGA